MSTNLHLLHMREQITQEARRKLSYAQQRVCQARTLRELALALNVRLGPELHSVGKRLPEWSRLQRQATEQGELLTKAQVAVLSQFALEQDLPGFDRELNRLRVHEWIYLRGRLPAIASLVERESGRMRSALVQALSRAQVGQERRRPQF